jgi:hypothetical protein
MSDHYDALRLGCSSPQPSGTQQARHAIVEEGVVVVTSPV